MHSSAFGAVALMTLRSPSSATRCSGRRGPDSRRWLSAFLSSDRSLADTSNGSRRDRQLAVSLSAMPSAASRPRRRITGLAAVTLHVGVLALTTPLGGPSIRRPGSVAARDRRRHRGLHSFRRSTRPPSGTRRQRAHQHGHRTLPDQCAAGRRASVAVRDRPAGLRSMQSGTRSTRLAAASRSTRDRRHGPHSATPPSCC